MVITGRARQALRRLTRMSETEEFRRIGETLALHAFKREGKSLDSAILTDALKRLKMQDEDTVYETLGRGELSMNEFVEAVFPGRYDGQEAVFPGRYDGQDEENIQDLNIIDDDNLNLYVKGDALKAEEALHRAPCCSPRLIVMNLLGKKIR